MFQFLFGQGVTDNRQPDAINRALFNFLNNDLPVINEDGFDYIQNGFMSVGAVYECVDLISKKIAKMPVIIYKVVDAKKLKQAKQLIQSDNAADRAKAMILKAGALQEVEIKSIRDLLDHPNEKQNWSEFIGLVVHLILLDGNAFAYGNGADRRSNKFTEMFALPFTSKEMTIISGGVLDPIKGYNAVWNAGAMNFPHPNQILHLKTINPRYSIQGSQLYGVSPLKAYTYQLVRDRLGNQQANKILKNGGLMGLISPKHKEDALADNQKEALKEGLQSAHRSSEDIARLIPVSIGMDYLQIGLPSADLQILDLVKSTREDIYRAYHVPLSYASNDSSTFNNVTAHGKRFMHDAVVPVSDYIGEKLTQWICPAYSSSEGSLLIELDYLSSPELTADMGETIKWLKETDMLTPNEKREVIRWGRLDDPLMDKVYMSKQKASIEKL